MAESAAFPAFIRAGSVTLLVALAVAGWRSWPEMRAATWSNSSLAIMCVAIACILWCSYWLMHSRTRLDGDLLRQTWMWPKQIRAADVVHMKLVHWSAIDWLIAPRLLVRQRGGGVTWFYAADGRLLRRFTEQVAARQFAQVPPA